MTELARVPLLLVLGSSLLFALACGGERSGAGGTTPAAEPSAAPSGLGAVGTEAKGSITAEPNPIRVCDGSGLGAASLTWTSTGAKELQVRVGGPNGALFSESGPYSGPQATQKWVGDGTTFYLQDVTDDLPLTSANTLSTVTVKVTAVGCP